MNDASRLLDALRARAQGRRRISSDVVWSAFMEAVRGYTGSVDARPRLAAVLDELACRGAVELPRSTRLWDHSASPALPVWVALPRDVRGAAPAVDHRSIAWPPELAFVAAMKRVPLVSELVAIQRFLAEGGRTRRLVPARERSVELFGDEKRIDALTSSAMFRDGRLSLELLRCYEVAPPLVWERNDRAASGSPILVLENLHTYDSFRRWNRRTAMYTAVAYGHGSEFKGTCRDVPRMCRELGTTTVRYFGDLDVEGLVIPTHARRVLWGLEDRIVLQPASRWYEALLDRGDVAVPANNPQDIAADLLDWLPSSVRDSVHALLTKGGRLPQELVGTDALEDL